MFRRAFPTLRWCSSNPQNSMTMRDPRIHDSTYDKVLKPPFFKHRRMSHPYFCSDFSKGKRKLVLRIEYDWRRFAREARELKTVLHRLFVEKRRIRNGIDNGSSSESESQLAQDEGNRLSATRTARTMSSSFDLVEIEASGVPVGEQEVRVSVAGENMTVLHHGEFKSVLTEAGLRNLHARVVRSFDISC
ncbi:unnamed protein product [Amoebophrya sp. A120]|nr:unnamed protein product [Amoebophrya sp. A120]|eukprot:GSA120T00000525001.1